MSAGHVALLWSFPLAATVLEVNKLFMLKTPKLIL